MDAVNCLYATFKDAVSKHEYDLRDLGAVMPGGQPLMVFSGGTGARKYFDAAPRPTTLEDYDGEFIEKIFQLNPVYKLEDFLDHHYAAFIASNNPDPSLFSKHIRYVILPKIERGAPKEIGDLIRKWFDKHDKKMIAQHLQEKNALLKTAYEAALEAYPSSPLSAKIDCEAMAEEMGYEISTVKRIVKELVAEHLATSVLGMKIFMITDGGRQYLQHLEVASGSTANAPMHVNVGSNSHVQIQHGSPNATQTIHNNTVSNEQLLSFLQDLKIGMEAIQKHLSGDDIATLHGDVAYLETALSRSSPNPTVLKTVSKGIVDIIKSVPANVMGNVVTNVLPTFHQISAWVAGM